VPVVRWVQAEQLVQVPLWAPVPQALLSVPVPQVLLLALQAGWRHRPAVPSDHHR